MTALDRVTSALIAHGRTGRGTSWQCPAHDDTAPSLSVNRNKAGDGVVINCHRDCAPTDIVAALGLTLADLYDEPRTERRHVRDQVITEYPYTDEHGEVLYVVKRIEPGYNGEKKTFRQYRPDGSAGVKGIGKVLYRLPDVVRAAAAGERIAVVEGEKDVEALAAIGVVATTNTGGAGKWQDADAKHFVGAKEVVVIADKDKAGRKHAAQVAESLRRAGLPFRVVEPAAGKDAADHLGYGLGLDALLPLADDATPLPEAPQPARRIKLTPASQITPEPVIWAWEPEPGEGRIPAGALTLAAGREGTGKSSFGIWTAAQLTRGKLPGSFHGRPRAVFYAAVEDSWSRTLVPRLMAADADLDLVYRLEVETAEHGETMISLPHDCALVEEAIVEHGAAALIIDPLMSTLGTGTDAHRTQDVRKALEPVVRMAERTACLTLGIAHFNKASGNDASQLISGSGAFKDLARAVIAFARDRESDEQVMTQTKNSLGRLLDLPSLGYRIDSTDVITPKGVANVGRLEFTGPTDRSVEDTLSAPIDTEEAGERAEAVTWLLGYLASNGGEVPRADVMKAAKAQSFSESTIKRARGKAKVTTTERQGFGGGTVWVHPHEAQSDHSQSSQVTSQSADPTGPTEETVTRLPERQSPAVVAAKSPEDVPDAPSLPELVIAKCAVCLDDMAVIEPGQTTHPGGKCAVPPTEGQATVRILPAPAVKHVIVDFPPRCFNQLMTAYNLAQEHGATLHATERCLGKPLKKRPGMNSGCMGDASDRCRHDLDQLRAEGAIDITPEVECWLHDGKPCSACDEGTAA